MTPMMTALLSVLSLAGCGAAGAFYARSLARRYGELLVPTDVSEQILRNATWRKETVLKTALQATQEHLQSEGQRFDDERAVVQRIQVQFDQELDQRQSAIDKRFNESDRKSQEMDSRAKEIEGRWLQVREVEGVNQSVCHEYEQHLEQKAGVARSDLLAHICDELKGSEQLAISRSVLERVEEVKEEAQRQAKDVLSVVTLRYNPKFIWPKSAFSVETPSKALAEEHFSRGGKIVSSLVEGLGIEVDLMTANETEPPVIKIAGGSGVEKEALRLTFEEIINRNEFNLDKIIEIREKYRRQLDKLTFKFGDEAAKGLGLSGVNPELLKLVGSLNYRTSHRQNQYYHSIEVGRLAGMLAEELGLDPLVAKRSGFLHDIGKALDYRIEGSHAVISADYAERFGESREVIDLVLSHHDDKILETAHAFVLKAADALSGARPGARIEMEEGYQKRIDAIAEVIRSFERSGVNNSAIMNAGREVHVFVDGRRVKEHETERLALAIVRKLESDVEFPGQIRVTVVRRTEVTEVA